MKDAKTQWLFSTLHPLSTVNFATATVLAFVLHRDSRLIVYSYTQREATSTQKLAQKCAATSRDFLCERIPITFPLANQLRWIAQYMWYQVWEGENRLARLQRCLSYEKCLVKHFWDLACPRWVNVCFLLQDSFCSDWMSLWMVTSYRYHCMIA